MHNKEQHNPTTSSFAQNPFQINHPTPKTSSERERERAHAMSPLSATSSPIPVQPPPYDRLKDLQNFDDTKAGVKGLLDSGLISTIPTIFHHPPNSLPGPTRPKPSHPIPTVDLSLPRPSITNQIRRAASEFGFFHVINHGIPKESVDGALESVRGFNELSVEERAAHYRRVPGPGFSYSSNVDLFKSKAASWRDSLQVRLGPVPPILDEIPDVAHPLVLEWDPEVKKVGEFVMGILCEGLGVQTERLKDLACSEARVMAAHYYPYCPQPDLTYGLTPHTDPGVITVLLQNDVRGLQVKYEDEWLDVEPVEGALVINVGDILQIMSNDEFKSVEHRVLANDQHNPRVSIAVFFNTSKREDMFGPLPELITGGKVANYCEFTLSDFMQRFFSKELDGKTLTNFYRI